MSNPTLTALASVEVGLVRQLHAAAGAVARVATNDLAAALGHLASECDMARQRLDAIRRSMADLIGSLTLDVARLADEIDHDVQAAQWAPVPAPVPEPKPKPAPEPAVNGHAEDVPPWGRDGLPEPDGEWGDLQAPAPVHPEDRVSEHEQAQEEAEALARVKAAQENGEWVDMATGEVGVDPDRALTPGEFQAMAQARQTADALAPEATPGPRAARRKGRKR